MPARDKNNGYEVGLVTKLVYSVGALCDSIKTLGFTTFLLFYYTTVLGLPGSWLALAMAVGLVWDATVDPLIGAMSDRVRPDFGRRHIFMLIGSVCAGLSFIAVFNPPAGLSNVSLFIWLMVSSFLVRTSISLFMVPYYALGAELSKDYHERTSIAGFRAGAVIIGTVSAIGTAFLVFLPNNSITGLDSKFAPGGYASMGVAFGVAMMIFGLVATFGTLHERPRLYSSAATTGSSLKISHSLLSIFRNQSFRTLFFSSALFAMATAINAALAVHFLTYHARVDHSQALTMYFAALYVGALAGVFVWVRVAKWVEKNYVYAVTTLIAAILISCGYWLVGEGRPFGTGNAWILILVNGLAGFFGSTAAVIVPSMMADITTQDELLTGRRREGIIFGAYSLGQQFAAAFAVFLAGVLVEHFAGLVPGQVVQSAATTERLAMISNLFPAVILAGAGVIAFRYRLTRSELQRILGKLASPTSTRLTTRRHA